MVALFVILTFAVMLLIDHLVLRQPIVVAEQPAVVPERPRALTPVVAGFKVSDHVRYHPGHTWAVAETPEMVRVGVDDFAAKVAGGTQRIDTPQRGQWIRQGQKIFSFKHDGRDINLVSPIEGTVVNVNESALEDPAITRRDPYGNGWLLEVHSPDAKTNLRNLLSGAFVRRWMEESAMKLRAILAPTAGAFAQDGGLAVDDLLSKIDKDEYETIEKEFFLVVA